MSQEDKDMQQSWFNGVKEIIGAVKNRLGLTVLSVIVISTILITVLGSEENTTSIIIAIGMVVGFLAIIFNMMPFNSNWNEISKKAGSWFNDKSIETYKVFISVPMSVYPTDEQYQAKRAEILSLMKELENNQYFGKAYFSGSTIESQDDFEAPDVAVRGDFTALQNSEIFMMVFTEDALEKPSSIIVEAGYALALSKPSVYFVKSRQNLPFMLREVPQVSQAKVKIYDSDNIKDIENIDSIKQFLQRNGKIIAEDLCD